MPTAFAMCVDSTPHQLIKLIGHDGSEVILPDYPEPLRRRSFHIQEAVRAIYRLGYLATPFEVEPKFLRPDKSIASIGVMDIKEFLRQDGVLLGTAKTKSPHAVAWNASERLIYDPNGSKYEFDEFTPKVFWAVTRRQDG